MAIFGTSEFLWIPIYPHPDSRIQMFLSWKWWWPEKRSKSNFTDVGVSWNRGTPESSTWMGFSMVNHPAMEVPHLWKPPIEACSTIDRTRTLLLIFFLTLPARWNHHGWQTYRGGQVERWYVSHVLIRWLDGILFIYCFIRFHGDFDGGFLNLGISMYPHLVGALENGGFFHSVGNHHHPNWLSYFSEGLEPPTRNVTWVYQ